MHAFLSHVQPAMRPWAKKTVDVLMTGLNPKSVIDEAFRLPYYLARWLLVTAFVAEPKNTAWLRLPYKLNGCHCWIIARWTGLRLACVPATTGDFSGASTHDVLL